MDAHTNASNADAPHVHSWAALTGKPSVFSPAPHVHDAAELASGILADARLSSNIPRLDAPNTFAHAGNLFNGSWQGSPVTGLEALLALALRRRRKS